VGSFVLLAQSKVGRPRVVSYFQFCSLTLASEELVPWGQGWSSPSPLWVPLSYWLLPSWSAGVLTAAHGWARLFLHSVASALLGVLLLVLVATYVFVEFFVNPMRLRTNQHFEGQFGL
jgi:hypothetical protein